MRSVSLCMSTACNAEEQQTKKSTGFQSPGYRLESHGIVVKGVLGLVQKESCYELVDYFACSRVNKFIRHNTIFELMRKVTVFSTKNCPYCHMAKAFLDKQGVHYESIDVGEDRDAAKKMIDLSGQRGVPVITVDDEVIVGFDSQRLNELFGQPVLGEIYDVLIIGAGPAGLTAGVYCARKMMNTIIISENIGGQALESWAIENYMGYRMITGEDLMKKFEEQVKTLNMNLELDRIVKISKEDELFTIRTISERILKAKTLILAQGNRPKKLGVANEEQFLGRGLSICSTCDGPLYKGKRVAVVGGGNSALQTVVEMSEITQSVSPHCPKQHKGRPGLC